MTEHDHRTYVDGCYRCELSRDEVLTTPADIIADTIDNWHDQMCDYLDGHHGVKPDTQERCILAALDAAGYQIVPKAERPPVCPECGSDNPLIAGGRRTGPWHGGAG